MERNHCTVREKRRAKIHFTLAKVLRRCHKVLAWHVKLILAENIRKCINWSKTKQRNFAQGGRGDILLEQLW